MLRLRQDSEFEIDWSAAMMALAGKAAERGRWFDPARSLGRCSSIRSARARVATASKIVEEDTYVEHVLVEFEAQLWGSPLGMSVQ